MPTSFAQIPAKGLGRLCTEGTRARAGALADHDCDLLVEVNVCNFETGQFRQPHPRIEEQADDRCVAAIR